MSTDKKTFEIDCEFKFKLRYDGKQLHIDDYTPKKENSMLGLFIAFQEVCNLENISKMKQFKKGFNQSDRVKITNSRYLLDRLSKRLADEVIATHLNKSENEEKKEQEIKTEV